MGLIRYLTSGWKLSPSVRYSRPVQWLSRFRQSDHYANLAADLEMYRRILGGRVPLVFDIGANHGSKAWVFRQLADRVVCVEPDPVAVSNLQARYRRSPEVVVVPSAVGLAEGSATLFVQADGSAYNSLSRKHQRIHYKDSTAERVVPITTLDKLIRTYGRPNFLKIDVEGYEREVISGLSEPVPALSFECNLPEFREETHAVLDALTALHPGTKYNLLPGHHRDLRFPTTVDADVIRAVVNDAACQTYEVFAFTDAAGVGG